MIEKCSNPKCEFCGGPEAVGVDKSEEARWYHEDTLTADHSKREARTTTIAYELFIETFMEGLNKASPETKSKLKKMLRDLLDVEGQ